MNLDLSSLSKPDETRLLARLAHELTVCARDTYEVGTVNVLDPQTLRASNELLHRVTASVREHVAGSNGFAVQTIVDMVRAFGSRHDRARAMELALENALQETRNKPLEE